MHYGDIAGQIEKDVAAKGAAGVEDFRSALGTVIDEGQPAKERSLIGWEISLESYGEDRIALVALVQEMIAKAAIMGASDDDVHAAYEATLAA